MTPLNIIGFYDDKVSVSINIPVPYLVLFLKLFNFITKMEKFAVADIVKLKTHETKLRQNLIHLSRTSKDF